jgi:hypothetical protein
MPDRLAELVRQRALVQEHLAWLDREIANARQPPSPGAEAPPLVSPPSISASSMPTVGTSVQTSKNPGEAGHVAGGPETLTSDVDTILAQYQVAPTVVKQDVRKGCFLYFAAAFVLLGLGVTLLYFLLSSR